MVGEHDGGVADVRGGGLRAEPRALRDIEARRAQSRSDGIGVRGGKGIGDLQVDPAPRIGGADQHARDDPDELVSRTLRCAECDRGRLERGMHDSPLQRPQQTLLPRRGVFDDHGCV